MAMWRYVLGFTVGIQGIAFADTTVTLKNNYLCLSIEALNNGWLRSNYRLLEHCAKPAFPTSPYVVGAELRAQPLTWQTQGHTQTAETMAWRVQVDTDSLCMSWYDKQKKRDASWVSIALQTSG